MGTDQHELEPVKITQMKPQEIVSMDDSMIESPELPRPIIRSYGHPFSLFVSMPTSEVHRLRDLGSIASSQEVRDKLELVAGLPSDTYTLRWPDDTEFRESDQLSFGQDTRDGAVIKAVILDEWKDLFMAICRNAKREVYRLVKEKCSPLLAKTMAEQTDTQHHAEDSLQDTDTGQLDNLQTQEEGVNLVSSEGHYVLFVCLFMACHRGLFDMVKRIIEQYGKSDQKTTPFGRSIVHAAVSRDHVLLLHLLLQNGHDPNVKDYLGISPFWVAMDIGACACLRVLKNNTLTCVSADQNSTIKKVNKRQIKSAPGKLMPPSQRKSSDCGKTKNILAEVHTHLENAKNKISRGDRKPNAASKKETAEEVRATCIRSAYHVSCKTPKPFVAQRTVNPSECKKLVTVEYTPIHGSGNAKKKVASKRNNSAKSINPLEDITSNNTTAGPGQRRPPQSTKYYETKYHKLTRQEEEYKPMPENAGSRFRFWKSWLLEKLEDDKKKKSDPEEIARKRNNNLAYRRWYKKKQNEGFPGDCTSSDDDDYDTRAGQASNERAFREWLDKKKVVFAARVRAKQEKARVEEEMARNGPSKVYDRRVTVFEMTSTEPLPTRYENPNKYHTSYQRWKDRRVRFDAWKERQAKEEDLVASDDKNLPKKGAYERDRKTLLLQGITYEEWLGLKQRQALANC